MRQEIIDLYDRYAHYGMERRELLARLAEIAGGTAAAAALLASLDTNYAKAEMVPANDSRLVAERVSMQGTAGDLRGYLAKPAGVTGPLPGVIVVHENRGLNPHIEDVARRVALQGFVALAPDFLSLLGGTPADPDRARDLIGQLDPARVVQAAQVAAQWLERRDDTTDKIGIMGFCWGGGVVGRVATKVPEIDAAVVFYGRVPPLADVPGIKSPLLLHYAGLDTNINADVPAFEKALKDAGVRYQLHVYEGANHAFHNDTSEARYDPAVAKLAFERTIAFFKQHLA